MESEEVKEQLQAIERGAAAPYINYPTTPLWYAPAIGAWAAAMVETFAWYPESVGKFAGSIAALVALELLFIVWMKRRHGALPMPGRGKPPAEIARVWRGYWIGLTVVAVVVAVLWLTVGIPVAAIATFVLVTAGMALYENRYAVAAAKTKARLQ